MNCMNHFSFSSDHLFKLLLVGDSGVGKTCLLLRFAVRKHLLNGNSGVAHGFNAQCSTLGIYYISYFSLLLLKHSCFASVAIHCICLKL